MPPPDHSDLAFSPEGSAVLCRETARLSRYLGAGQDVEDLMQAGRIGLLLAARRYDPRRGGFGAYARWWVLAEMSRVIHASRSPVPIPRSVRCQLRTAAALSRQEGVPLDSDKLVQALGVSVRQAEILLTLLRGGGEDEVDGGLLADPMAGDEERLLGLLEQERLVSLLRQEVARLPAREQQIIIGLYGLESLPGLTLQQVGAVVGLSHQRVQQLHHKVLLRLRQRLQGVHPCPNAG